MVNERTPVVLVADDDPSMLMLVAQHARMLGYRVLEASDGDEALQLAREHLPDLIVLDVMMPGASGWDVCRRVREDVALAHTGVVMLTGMGETINAMTSPLHGADEYIDKPFEFPELDEKIRSTLAKRASLRRAAPGLAHSEPAAAADEGDEDADDPPAPSSRRGSAKKATTKRVPTKRAPRKAAKKTAQKRATKKAAAKKVAAKPARKGAGAKKVAAKPARKAASTKKAAAKPGRKAAAPKRAATKPARKAAGAKKVVAKPARKAAGAKKVVAKPARKAVSAKRVTAKPARKATKKAGRKR